MPAGNGSDSADAVETHQQYARSLVPHQWYAMWKYQMSGLCRRNRGGNRIKISHLSHKDNIRVLTEWLHEAHFHRNPYQGQFLFGLQLTDCVYVNTQLDLPM